MNLNIGKRIKQLRNFKGITAQKLADTVGVTRIYITKLENNENNPSLETLFSICDALGVTLSEFFSIDEEDSDSLPPEYIELVKNAKNLSPEQLKILNDFIKNF